MCVSVCMCGREWGGEEEEVQEGICLLLNKPQLHPQPDAATHVHACLEYIHMPG